MKTMVIKKIKIKKRESNNNWFFKSFQISIPKIVSSNVLHRNGHVVTYKQKRSSNDSNN